MLAGRIAVLLGLALLTAGGFTLLVVVGSRPDRLGDVVLGLTLGSLVSVALGWAVAAVIPHQLEGTLVLIGLAGIAPSAPCDLGTYLPFYALLRFSDVTVTPPPAALPLVLRALGYTAALTAVALLVWRRRVRPAGA